MLGDSDSESSVSSLDALKINQDFATAYKHKKEREELSKLQDKYGWDGEGGASSDESVSESEDEDGDELTPQVDAAILRTLARIKKRSQAYMKMVGSKPLTIKQQALNEMLGLDQGTSRSPSPSTEPTHVQEQSALRAETITAFTRAVDDEEDDFLVPRSKTKDELEQEEEDYRAFLEREVGEDIRDLIHVENEDGWKQRAPTDAADEQPAQKKKGKKERAAAAAAKEQFKSNDKSRGTDRDADADTQFLWDYILNRGWIDNTERHVPTYNEITTGSSSKRLKKKTLPLDDSDDDAAGRESRDGARSSDGHLDEEDFDEANDDFEQRYNSTFKNRAATIGAHPRPSASTANALGDTVRRADTRRKEARERRKARKDEELLKKQEEVKRLKALKLKELRRKIERIGREGRVGFDSEALAALDLDGDWDPTKHDEQMAGIYGQGPDGQEGEEGYEEDDEKPTWDDDIDIDDIVPSSAAEAKSDKKLSKAQRKRAKRLAKQQAQGVRMVWMQTSWTPMPMARRTMHMQAGMTTGPMGSSRNGWYMRKLDEMEFNDIVGDLPTRFHYATVLPDSHGLSSEDIFLATDAELNSYAGIKRYAAYRKKGKSWDSKRPEKLKELREAINGRRWDGSREFRTGIRNTDSGWAGREAEADGEKKKRKGKKERLKEKSALTAPGDDEQEVDATSSKKKRKAVEDEAPVEDEAVVDEGHKKKRKKSHVGAE
ncbi:KRI1-like family-domain-containing protein [Auriculariales sp. MPI-PUGE-AT-0066]|nr:KRI1-like family-domain-containing protein [Auriculariales sp. MPI-PUGE-AT-0066]